MKNIKLSIKKIYQSYDKKATLNGISLDIFEGELLAILGPSGCGKTSLLKAISGLIPIDKGSITLDGQAIESLSPQSRKTAMIFQNYALFPHMTVLENIEYGLKIKRENNKSIKEKSERIIDLIKLRGFESRPVNALSGGQQQRVAIGRAMIVEPAVLLFDEPLSNLDENLRVEMRADIKKILKSVNITSIYVTHDQNEAMSIADRIVIMKDGEIEQISSPELLYFQPRSEYVARFIGHKNIFDVEIRGKQIYLFGQRLGDIDIEDDVKNKRILIHGEDINIYPVSDDLKDVSSVDKIYLKGKIIEIEVLTNIRKYLVQVNEDMIYVTVLNRATQDKLTINDEVVLEVNKDSYHILSN